jgi:DNA-binding MarR family transcriptional regulator
MNLRLNPLQRAVLLTLKQRPWSTPQQLSSLLCVTPRQAGAITKQLHLAGAAALRQEQAVLGEGLQRRTKIVRTYRLTAKGRRLATKVTADEVLQFIAEQKENLAAAAPAETDKKKTSAASDTRQRNKRGIIIRTPEEVFANATAKFPPGEWFFTKDVQGTAPVMDELVKRSLLECGKPTSSATRAFRRPKKDGEG